VVDFSSALYLGFRHGSGELPAWGALTAGKPAALWEPRLACATANRVAELQGCETGVVGPSTFHLYWDLFGGLAKERPRILLDSGAYPVSRWGVERAACSGGTVRLFRHHDVSHLASLIGSGRGRPVVVMDGYCPACGRTAPVDHVLPVVKRASGLLVMDDTQALGVLGERPSPCRPYGMGGGGLLRYLGLARDPAVVLISSLAKGFGAPLAVLSGARELADEFKRTSELRVHSSPASAAALAAAATALNRNEHEGESLRERLARLVRYFRRGLRRAKCAATGGLFPVQVLRTPRAEKLYRRLLEFGIQTVPHASRLSVILTARHTKSDVDRLLAVLS
jgi:8-amino-7-oxononanoate synthase